MQGEKLGIREKTLAKALDKWTAFIHRKYMAGLGGIMQYSYIGTISSPSNRPAR